MVTAAVFLLLPSYVSVFIGIGQYPVTVRATFQNNRTVPQGLRAGG
jgi:hypothetical protein